MLDLGFINHLFQGMRKVGNDHNGGGAAVVKLMFQFARGIKRIDVHDNHASAQDTKQRHRILQQIRHHQRDTVAFLQA